VGGAGLDVLDPQRADVVDRLDELIGGRVAAAVWMSFQ
jgi:hypothetical protein